MNEYQSGIYFLQGSGNDCVSLNQDSGGQWSDEACTGERGYVCKTKKCMYIQHLHT